MLDKFALLLAGFKGLAASLLIVHFILGFAFILMIYKIMESSLSLAAIFGTGFTGSYIYAANHFGSLWFDFTAGQFVWAVSLTVLGAIAGAVLALVLFEPDTDVGGDDKEGDKRERAGVDLDEMVEKLEMEEKEKNKI